MNNSYSLPIYDCKTTIVKIESDAILGINFHGTQLTYAPFLPFLFYDFAVSPATQRKLCGIAGDPEEAKGLQMMQIMLIDKMGSRINIMLVGIILSHMLSYTKDHLAAAQKRVQVAEPNCDETPPNCDVFTYYRVYNFNKYIKHKNRVPASLTTYFVNSSSSHSVCSVDPFEATTFRHENSSWTISYIYISCSQPGTRVVIRPGTQYIIQSGMYNLFVTNCIMYWKDISLLGQLFVLHGMCLVDWEDEFTTGETEYFDSCVHLEEVNGDDLGIRHSIAGCTNVGEIVVKSTIIRPLSPVFVRYLWPAIAEATIERYRFLHNPCNL